MFAGYLYDVDWFNIQSFRLPQRLERFCTVIGSFFSRISTSTATANAASGTAAPSAGRAANRRPQSSQFDSNSSSSMNNNSSSSIRHRPSSSAIATPPPDEESIIMLMGMGFDRDSVVRAMLMTGNNVEAAANLLLH